MFFDREKIKKERFLFWFSVCGVSMGLVLWGVLLNMFRQSTTVTAEVVDEYVSGSSVNNHPYGSKINIEWMDEDGDIHSEGNLSNPKGLTVGDTLQIQVDAATQSERILDGPGKLFLFIAGAVFVGLYSYPLLSFRKGKKALQDASKQISRLAANVDKIKGAIQMNGVSAAIIKGKLGEIIKDMQEEKNNIKKMAEALTNISQKYIEAENRIKTAD